MKHTILFAAMLCVAMTATANNAKISGRIKDANDKSAIIGATVLLMQDTVQIAGTTTDPTSATSSCKKAQWNWAR